jgi:hypothetical protein
MEKTRSKVLVIILIVISYPPFSSSEAKENRPPPAEGSRLRHWLCPSLLSAHLNEASFLASTHTLIKYAK